ncbi:hypothetical protein MES4922_730011 [Mesorhizobium ventifaucium]|uniref:Uncharacterized protein n=1 Tax=Mesorhizobium ventifaucium TaxID=666020 RepID=A0ABM9EFK3_9HYPH|nr:hypothetical protein MES4922_730011 [Mesorhizobium ventifaucium]
MAPANRWGRAWRPFPKSPKAGAYLITGSSTAAGSGGGAFPFPLPIQPFAQPLRLVTARVATITINILLIKQSFPQGRKSL